MKRILLFLFSISLIIPLFTYADDADKSSFPPTQWTSKDSDDHITIQNGAGSSILILINVNSGGPNTPGVNIDNCGTTKHINSGSSTVCETNDAANPVTITSDSPSNSASGTYQVRVR